MTGEHVFRGSKKLVSKNTFFPWLDSIGEKFKLFGPVTEENQTVFRQIGSSKELTMEYRSTMLPPGKLFIYKPKEEICTFHLEEDISIEEIPAVPEKQAVIAVHPCDMNAILYLDHTFLGMFKDPYYEARRKNTLTICLNCTQVSLNCFCSSVNSGPFLKEEAECDILLTDFGDDYLVEIRSRGAERLFGPKGKVATSKVMKMKSEKEKAVLSKIRKVVNMEGLDRLFLENMNHPVWQRTADERCLSCSNCVLVCPTCFCYQVVDETSMDLRTVTRYRHLDACQDMRFAEIFGGNFRQRRASRLRQFVTHKMNQTAQYGMPGTVGCGRCITWCPTSIDLTEITKEIQRS
ncbi:MAG: 4Fe-4S dicluster domain-containing protein [Nitrospirota bacterium]